MYSSSERIAELTPSQSNPGSSSFSSRILIRLTVLILKKSIFHVTSFFLIEVKTFDWDDDKPHWSPCKSTVYTLKFKDLNSLRRYKKRLKYNLQGGGDLTDYLRLIKPTKIYNTCFPLLNWVVRPVLSPLPLL